MSKRSRAQREIERMNREQLAMAQRDPKMVPFPDSCSDAGCHNPAAIAVTIRRKRGEYQGWSGCLIHVPKLTAIFRALESHSEAIKAGMEAAVEKALLPGSSGLAIQVEKSDAVAVSDTPTSSDASAT